MDKASRDNIVTAVVSALMSSIDIGDEELRESSFLDFVEEMGENELAAMKEEGAKALIVRLVIANDAFQKHVGDTVDGFLSELAFATRQRLGLPEDEGESSPSGEVD